jgi:hypothetical protein
MPPPMTPPPESEERFSRERGQGRLAEAPRTEAVDLDVAELLNRLEEQAAENGKLAAQVESLEREAAAERAARRRLAETLKRERNAAAAIHERAERDRQAHAALSEEFERVREGADVTELHVQQAWARLADAELRLAQGERSVWRRLLRRPVQRG